MVTEEYASADGGKIRCFIWESRGEPRGIVQLVHGIAEHSARYERFAEFLAEHGYTAASEDHMGHGASVSEQCPVGCVRGGWEALKKDVYSLTVMLKQRYPDRPLFMLGHSMGSFLARSLLYSYPDAGLKGALISGTAWQPGAVLAAGKLMCRREIQKRGADTPSPRMKNLMFGAYVRQFRDAVTPDDWISSVRQEVERYNRDELCGFVPSGGMLLAMLEGLSEIQEKDRLRLMPKELPVLFFSGEMDPVGGNGSGVKRSRGEFIKAGMKNTELKLYPGARHEVLNEFCRQQAYDDVLEWLDKNV